MYTWKEELFNDRKEKLMFFYNFSPHFLISAAQLEIRLHDSRNLSCFSFLSCASDL